MTVKARYGFWMSSMDCGVVWAWNETDARLWIQDHPERYTGTIDKVVRLKVQVRLPHDKDTGDR